MQGNLDIARNLGVRQNVCIRVIDEPSGKVVQEHTGHNAATSTILTGIGQFLMGGSVTGAGELLDQWIPQYISLGTMGLINQDSDNVGLPAGIGDTTGNEEFRFVDYMKHAPGFAADGYSSDPELNNHRSYFGLGPIFSARPDPDKTIKCELISKTFPRAQVTYRNLLPESRAETPKTIDVVFSTFVSTGALAQFREPGRDYLFITEAGLWSSPTYVNAGLNGMLAGYRLCPPDRENWDMTIPANRQILKENIIKVGINQVVQVIWKIQLGAIEQLGDPNAQSYLITKNIYENGTYRASDEGYAINGYSSVTVDVPPSLKTKTITHDGTYLAADEGVDGYDKVISSRQYMTKVITADGEYLASQDNVDGYDRVVSSRQYANKTITANGQYSAASDNVDGYKNVTVNIQGSYGAKTINKDGTYYASADNLDGYNVVTSHGNYATRRITKDGTYRASDEGLDAYDVVISSRQYMAKTVTANGTYTASSENVDGYSSVTVNVNPRLSTKEITADGVYRAIDDGVDGYSSIISSRQYMSKTVTQNGTYNASSDNVDGYSSVVVNVPTGGSTYYVEPQSTRLEPIESGTARTILWVYFTLDEAERVRFRSTLNFNVTLDNGSSSATVTLKYYWDTEGQSEPVTATYTSNGSQVLTVDYLLPELAAGDHVFEVDLGVVGGTVG